MVDDQNLSKFWQSVPSFHVLVQLMLTRDRNPHAPTQTNDGRDLAFLKLAIPYANIVMTENLWTHVANHSGLACLYNTEVRSDLGDLPELLRRLGCE